MRQHQPYPSNSYINHSTYHIDLPTTCFHITRVHIYTPESLFNIYSLHPTLTNYICEPLFSTIAMLGSRSWCLLGFLLPVLGLPHYPRFGSERRVDVQSHRGGAGMRTEESLWVYLFWISSLLHSKLMSCRLSRMFWLVFGKFTRVVGSDFGPRKLALIRWRWIVYSRLMECR
jgi:hypothetical protein